MTPKSRTQLLQALQQRQTPTPKDMPQEIILPPLTATCWAAASWQDVCPAAGEGPHVKPPGRRGAAAAGDRAYNGFDLCIGDGTVHEGDFGLRVYPVQWLKMLHIHPVLTALRGMLTAWSFRCSKCMAC